MSRRIVIVGGGFGGVFVARRLANVRRDDIAVELINSENYFVFQPLLPEVASGTINAPDAVTPLRQLLPGVRVRMATVTGVDLERRRVHLLQGSHRKPQQVDYDEIVIAVGQQTNIEMVAGFAEHALCMRDLADAHELRNKIIRRLEHADITEDPLIKQRLLTFVVAGGGFSGVETIGEVIEMIRRTLRFYPNVAASDIRAVLVESGDRVLRELPARLGHYAERLLRKRGVEILTGRRVSEASQNAVFLDDGTRIESCLIVTTVGNGPRPFVTRLGINLQRGRIPVDETLRMKSADHAWALGDAAAVPLGDGFAPPTAQFATAEAKVLAKNLLAALDGKAATAFGFNPKGMLASIGNYKGVAQVFGIGFSGLIAWMAWRFLYIGMLPGFSTRLRVALNWMFDYVLPRSIVQIANQGRPATVVRRYKKGDVVFAPGQRLDGFYSVIEGRLESRLPAGPGEAEQVRLLSAGDHWGERSLTKESLTRGSLTAVEDSRVLVLSAQDFLRLRNGLAAFDEMLQVPDPALPVGERENA